MSHTSDRVNDHLTRASAAGMPHLEIERWRQELDERTLDMCGCDASAKASVVAATVLGLWLIGRRKQAGRFGLASGALGTLSAAIAGKVLGQHLASQRRERLLDALAERTREVASWSK